MRKSDKSEMVKCLSEIVVPALRSLGFKGSFPHFRRQQDDRINLLTFQFDRSGGGFFIEIANCQANGIITSWGLEIKPNKVTAHDVNKRKRIQSNMNTESSLNEDWFRYDKDYLFGLGNVYKKICKEVLQRIPIAEDYWKNGEVND